MVRDDPTRELIPGLRAASSRDAGAPSWAAAGVVPSQFFSGADWREAARGEVALRLAILEDAICCFEREVRGAGVRTRRLARDAERWLFRDDRSAPFSFLDVCDALGIEPGPLRRWLRARRASPGGSGAPHASPARRRHIVVRHGRSPRAA